MVLGADMTSPNFGTSQNTWLEAMDWLQHWPDGLIGLDNEFRIRFCSQQALSLLGWPSERIIGLFAHDLLCVKTRDFFHQAHDCLLCSSASDSHHTNSSFWLTADGFTISVDFRVIPLGDQAGVHRIISFQSNESRAHSSEEAANVLAYVEHSPAPIAEFDLNGQVLFGNPAFNEALLEYGFNDLGQSLILPQNLSDLCAECLRKDKIFSGVEVEVDGHWLRWHFAPLKRPGAKALVGYAFDVTEQKRLELQDANEKARLRRDFYAKMVHELRTPLNAIIGFAQVLLRRLDQIVDERELANLRAIKMAGLQLNQMISNTLELSKIDAGKMDVEVGSFSLNEMLAVVSEQLQGLAHAKGLNYRCECEEGLVMESDLDKVRQILVNLISNAIKYTHAGEIAVAALRDANQQLVVTVTDTGVGISQEHMAGLFDAYGRIRGQNTQNIQGTGLGLALVSEFVEMLHGDISLVSEAGKGSCFKVMLPLEHRPRPGG
jgi:two-component system, autoinducer 2 sensor kinase/phosphatase LuxQ